MSSTIRERFLAATAGVAVLLGGLGVAASALADNSENAQGKVTTTTTLDGSLTWGVKESFRSYLTGPIATGSVTVSGGASKVDAPGKSCGALVNGREAGANCLYDFPLASGQSYDESTKELAFDGSVFFSGHHGILETTISNPVLDLDRKVLKATVSSRDFINITDQAPNRDYGQIDLAQFSSLTVSEEGNTISISGTGATITADGVLAFGGGNFYRVGEAMDNLSGTLTKTVVEHTEEPTDPATEPTDPATSPTDPVTQPTDPVTSPTDPATGPTAPSATSALNWGIYDQWVNYILSPYPEAGVITVAGGAAQDGKSFVFPLADGQTLDSDKLTTIAFAGSVNFSKHHGVLNVTVENPTLVKTNEGWVLMVTARSGDAQLGEIPFATLDGASVTVTKGTAGSKLASVSISFESAKLTADGEKVFASPTNPKYQQGVGIAVPSAVFPAAVKDDNGGDPTGQPTDEPTDQPTGQPTDQPSTPSNPTTPGTANPTTPGTGATTPSSPNTPAKECVVDNSKTRVTSGSLSWGIKESFTTYIRGAIAHGGWTLGGATWSGGAFGFPATGGLYDTAAQTGTIYFSGSIHFTGHDGILDLTMSDPALVINGNQGSLYMSVVGSDMQGNPVNVGRTQFATVALSNVSVTGGTLSFSSSAVTLTSQGAQAFAGFYEAGQALDNLTGSAKLAAATSCDPVTGEKIYYDAFGKVTSSELANTGADVNTQAALALIVLMAGAAMVVMRRKVTK